MCKRGRRTTWEYRLYSEVRTEGLSPTNELTRWRSLYFWSVVCKIIRSRRHLPCLIPISKGLIWRLSLRGNILLRVTSLWRANIWVCVIECAHQSLMSIIVQNIWLLSLWYIFTIWLMGTLSHDVLSDLASAKLL